MNIEKKPPWGDGVNRGFLRRITPPVMNRGTDHIRNFVSRDSL